MKYQNKEWLEQEYVQNDRSGKDIAEELGCSPSTVYNWASKHDLSKDQTNLDQTDREFIQNALVSQRLKLARDIGKQYGGDRDLYENFGYKSPSELDFECYWNKYQRQDIAARIVDAPAQTTWRNPPEVKVNDEEWEEWEKFIKSQRVYHYMERADRLSGIGRYGALLIGVAGGENLKEPLIDSDSNAQPLNSSEDILYLSAFHEDSCEIYEYEGDPTSERFGRPLYYLVDLTGENLSSSKAEREKVHWSRIIHIAEGKLEDEVYGEPRLKKVYNRLDDLMKVVGGSAEMFWQGAAPGFEIRADSDAGLPDDKLKEKMDEYIHNLRRYIPTAKASIETIDTEIEQPKEVFDHLISLISAKTGIPRRMLLGSERGDLASTQDEANWFGQIGERQQQFAGPEILRTFIDRLIEAGAFEGIDYEIEWPNLFELSELEEAELHAKTAKALKDASAGMPSDIATTGEIREMLGLPEEMPEDEAMNERPLDEGDEQVREQFKQ